MLLLFFACKFVFYQFLVKQSCFCAVTDDETELCELDSDSGPCDADRRAYYYNRHSRRCEDFVWGGCGGNPNRFTSVSDCEQRCIYLETATSAIRSTQQTTVLPSSKNATPYLYIFSFRFSFFVCKLYVLCVLYS